MAVQPWKRIEPTIVTKIDYQYVVIKTFEVPDTDEKKTYATFLAEDRRAAGVVALTKDNQVIVIRQFRQGPESMMDEIPGGNVEPGEDTAVAATRELLEETSYICGNLDYLGVCSRDAYVNGKWYYYLATDCELSPAGQQLDVHERGDVKLISIEEFIHNAKTDKMTDAVAVLMAYDKLKKIQEDTHA